MKSSQARRTFAPVIAVLLGSTPAVDGFAQARQPATPPAASAPAVAAPASPPSAATGPELSLLEVVQNALALHPNISSAKAEVAVRVAEQNAARGPFDPRLTSGLSHRHEVTPVLPNQRLIPEQRAIVTDRTDLTVGAAVTTIYGTSILPSVGLSRVHERLKTTVRVPGLLGDPYQQARAELAVTQPLLRGAGRVGAAAQIEAARLFRGAAEHALAQTAQEQVYLALIAYFQLVAADRQLGLLRAAEEGAAKLVAETQVLVESDQRPRSDLRQLEGNLANRRRAVAEAENTRVQSLHDLALAMGLGVERALDWRPKDDFPPVRAPNLDRKRALEVAKTSRSDVLAARANVEGASALVRGADHNTLPLLDLTASVGYNAALDDDGVDAFFASPAHEVRGVNAGVGLVFELPFDNAAQRADRDVKAARYDQARILAADLERTLPVAVAQAIEDLRLSADALAAANEAVTQYELAVTDQRDKLLAGAGTVIDMILIEELRITAQQNQTANQLRCALALTRLMFETGALPKTAREAATMVGRLRLGEVARASQ